MSPSSTHLEPVLRIALVEFPPSGGLYQFAFQLGSALAQRGHQVVLLTGPDPEITSDRPGFRVISALPTWHPTAGGNSSEWWRRARRGIRAGQHGMAWLTTVAWLRRNRPDVVLWSSWRFAMDGAGVLAARRALPRSILGLVAHEPVPLVEQPGEQALEKQTGGPDSLLGRAYRALDVAFVLGEQAQAALRRAWQPTAPVVVIPHGPEEVFLGAAAPVSASTTVPEVLFFGTITGYKGLDDLLRLWPKVRAEVPDATLRVAGNISADVDQAVLRARIADCEGVRLEPGYVATDSVAGLFTAARVVALPYRRSSQSGVAHLAQTFARAVVTTRVGDIPTVVTDGVSGLVVEQGDDEAFTQALVRLLRDPQLAERFGQAGQEQLHRNASWEQVAEKVEQAVHQVATG